MMGATVGQVCSKHMLGSLLAYWSRAEQLSIICVRSGGYQMTSGPQIHHSWANAVERMCCTDSFDNITGC